jgi:hypothetical protein
MPPTWWFAIGLVAVILLCSTTVFFLDKRSRKIEPTSIETSISASKAPSISAYQKATTPPPNPSARHIFEKTLSYGTTDGQVGLVHNPEQEPIGPESFSITPSGEVLVADVVNQRISIFAKDGSYLRSIDMAGVRLGDVTADRDGRLIVYDQVQASLHCYELDGTLRSSLALEPKDIDTRGYFHCVGDAVYFADAAVRDVLVATVRDGTLQRPDDGPTITEGIHGESSRVYSVSIDKSRSFSVRLTEESGGAGGAVQVPLAGVVAARFAGEDGAQGFCVQTEKLEGEKIVLEVHAFDASGLLRDVTRLPENDYFTWTAKLVDVQPDGTIVQFVPQREQAKLNFFAN